MRTLYSNLFVFPVLLCSVLLAAQSPALANDDLLAKEAQYVDAIVQDQNWQSGLPLISVMQGHVDSLADYQFDSNLEGVSKNELKKGGGRYFFKRDNRVRLEVNSGGMNNGCVVVRKEDGTVRGAGGGMLRFVKMTLQPNSRILNLPNGYNVLKSDLSTLLDEVAQKAKAGAQVKVSAGTVHDKRFHMPVKVVDVTKGDHLLARCRR